MGLMDYDSRGHCAACPPCFGTHVGHCPRCALDQAECGACEFERTAGDDSSMWSDVTISDYQSLISEAVSGALCDEHLDERPGWWDGFLEELESRGIEELEVPAGLQRAYSGAYLPGPIARLLWAYDLAVGERG